MNKLDQLMAQYQPLSAPLTDSELQHLKRRVMSKSRPRHRARRISLALAAAVCLLAACGAAVIGLFDTMTGTNQTAAMVEEYGLTIENPQSAQVDGHTVTVHAVIRSDTIARIIYDVSGSRRQVSDWETFRDKDGRVVLRIQPVTNGQPSGHVDALPGFRETEASQLRQSGFIGKTEDTGAMRCYADLDLTEDADTVSLYIQSESGGAEVIEVPLLNPVPEKALTFEEPVQLTVSTRDGNLECELYSIVVTPFRLTVEGTRIGNLGMMSADLTELQNHIRLCNQDGTEIKLGKDGSLFTASGSYDEKDFTIELNSYDLLNPSDITSIEIDGVSYPLPET